MSNLLDPNEGTQCLFMGNEAIARGALEAGVSVAAGYPGTPSSEIIENLSRVAGEKDLYVQWATNEKIATEIAAAAISTRTITSVNWLISSCQTLVPVSLGSSFLPYWAWR